MHACAAALHGLRDFDHAPIELVVTRWHRRVRRPSGLVVHESTDLRGVDIGSRRGIPTTTLVRTLVDLPAVVPAHRAGDALDHAIRRDAAILPRVHQRHLEVARRGRRGTAALRELLVECGQGTARVDSGFERRALHLLERHSFPAPQTQHQVRADDFVCYLDIAWPYALVALECDSYEFHSDRRSFAWDRKRRRILLSLGWTVLEATYSEVVGEDPQLLAQLKHLLLP